MSDNEPVWEEMAAVTGDHHTDDPDHLDDVAEEIARATSDIPSGVTLERSPEQAAAAAALQAAATNQPEPDTARPIEALATTTGTSRIGDGHLAVMIHIPNSLAARILDERLDIAVADSITPATALDTIADHIHDVLPHSLGPPTVEQWRARIETMQAEDLGRIDQAKLDAWTEQHDSEIRS